MDVRALNHLSLEELQDRLHERGLDTSGKKFTLAERLSAALGEERRRSKRKDDTHAQSLATCDPYLDPYFFGPQAGKRLGCREVHCQAARSLQAPQGPGRMVAGPDLPVSARRRPGRRDCACWPKTSVALGSRRH
ncbi:unnamed protein product [Effrenium voratum]|uniref:SAP domain-containing protein n=1 Tax=Effrenium voratum TaxID=2562239 RepID=A0AA36MSL4_9DINO|nr:unnamed protein product [Effrenium voratum]